MDATFIVILSGIGLALAGYGIVEYLREKDYYDRHSDEGNQGGQPLA